MWWDMKSCSNTSNFLKKFNNLAWNVDELKKNFWPVLLYWQHRGHQSFQTMPDCVEYSICHLRKWVDNLIGKMEKICVSLITYDRNKFSIFGIFKYSTVAVAISHKEVVAAFTHSNRCWSTEMVIIVARDKSFTKNKIRFRFSSRNLWFWIEINCEKKPSVIEE